MSLPKKKFKAIIFDCDGTLIESRIDALPTEQVRKAIAKASEKLHIGIATQRDTRNAKPILKYLQITGPSVVNGGARIIDSQTFKILREELIQIEDFHKAIEIIQKFNSPIFIQDSNEMDKQWVEGYIPQKPIVIFIPNLTEEIADSLKKELSVVSNISVHKVTPWGGLFGIVISSALATKQHGIFEVAKILGIKTREIIGVGDSYNDFPLLMACGLKVAMGNAVSELKAIADYIAPSVEDDGVVDVINKFVL